MVSDLEDSLEEKTKELETCQSKLLSNLTLLSEKLASYEKDGKKKNKKKKDDKKQKDKKDGKKDEKNKDTKQNAKKSTKKDISKVGNLTHYITCKFHFLLLLMSQIISAFNSE